jgi:hypothetical protein
LVKIYNHDIHPDQLPDIPEEEGFRIQSGHLPVINSAPALIPGSQAKELKNWCGQAAAASVIKYYGLSSLSDGDLLTQIYNQYPPDIMDGNWGTSGEQVVKMLKKYGLSRSFNIFLGGWQWGGFTNPANQPGWQVYWQSIKAKYIDKNIPIIILADTGKIGGDWWNLHWLIWQGESNNKARLTHALKKIADKQFTYTYSEIDTGETHRAWECYFVPHDYVRFHVVVPMK